jgi:hypothetical protein
MELRHPGVIFRARSRPPPRRGILHHAVGARPNLPNFQWNGRWHGSCIEGIRREYPAPVGWSDTTMKFIITLLGTALVAVSVFHLVHPQYATLIAAGLSLGVMVPFMLHQRQMARVRVRTRRIQQRARRQQRLGM